jgi:biopolymer transport protein ExbD
VKLRRPKSSDVDLGTNIINLVDVLLLLLIFFMITTTFTKKSELTLQLPEASFEPTQRSVRQIEIVISADGQYGVNENSLVDNELKTLQRALRDLAAGDTSMPMVITADARTPHEYVIRAMDAAAQLGFTKLSLTTQLPEPER